MHEGVVVGDQELGETFETEPECSGKTELDEKEKQVLILHPKYTVFNEVSYLK